MSRSIDQRIVEMRFDNQQFEAGAEQTLSTLDKLKNSLDLFGSGKSSTNLGAALFGGVSSGLEEVSNGFSALEEIATGALRRIGEQAVELVEHLFGMVNPLNYISGGWNKYADETSAVQMLMSSTKDAFEDEESQMEAVENELAKLMWFTDETSYSYLDMVENIGKFTSQGQELGKSTTYMMGIANWMAAAGVSTTKAGIAMDVLSKSLGRGYLMLRDWDTLESTLVATPTTFRQILLDTAVDLKKLKKVGEDTYQSLVGEGDPFTMGGIRGSLSKGKWFDTELLTTVLDKYGRANDYMYDILQNTGDYYDTTNQLLDDMAAYKDGTLDIDFLSRETGQTVEWLADKFDTLASSEFELSVQSFKLGQEAKTFGEAMGSVADAASSKWKEVIKSIFGNYTDARKLWTTVANDLWDAFVGPIDRLASIMGEWKSFGGRDAFLSSVRNSWTALGKILQTVKDGFHEIYPEKEIEEMGESLAKLTKKFSDFTNKLIISDDTADKLKRTFKGVFAVFDIVGQVIKAAWHSIQPLVNILRNLRSELLGTTASLGDWLASLAETWKANNTIQNTFDAITGTLTKFFGAIDNGFKNVAGNSFFGFLKDVGTAISSFCATIGKALASLNPFKKKNGLDELTDNVEEKGSLLQKILGLVGGVIGSFANTLKEIAGGFTTPGATISEVLGKITDSLANFLQNGSIAPIMTALIGGGLGAGIVRVLWSVTDAIWAISDPLYELTKHLNVRLILKIALSILALALAVKTLSAINPADLAGGLAALGAILAEMYFFLKALSNIFKKESFFEPSKIKSIKKVGIIMIGIAAALLILSSAIKKLGDLNTEQLVKGLVAVGVLLKEIQVFLKNANFANGAGIGKALGLVITVLAINNLAKAVKKLGELDVATLAKGLITVYLLGRIMREFGVMLDRQQSMGIGKAIGLMLVASSMLIMYKAVQKLGSLDLPTIGKGLLSIGVLLLELSIFTKLAGGYKHMISIGIGVMAIATAIILLAGPMKELGGLSLGEIGKGLLAMGGAMLIIALAINHLPKSTILIAAGLVVVGAALKIITSALKDMARFEPEEVAVSLVMLAASLVLISLSLNAMKGTLGAAAAFAIMAVSLNLLVPILERLGSMGLWPIIKALIGLAGAIATITVAATFLTPLAPALLLLAGAVTLLGGATLAAGLGLSVLTSSLASLLGSAAASAAVASFVYIVKEIAKLIPATVAAILISIGEGFVGLLKVLGDSAAAIGTAVVQIGTAVLAALRELIPQLVETVLYALQCILQSIYDHVPIIVNLVMKIIISVCNTIAENSGAVVASVVNMIIAIAYGIFAQLPVIIQAGFDLFLGLIYGITEAIQTNTPLVVDAIGELIQTVIDSAKYMLYSFIESIPVIGKIPGVADWLADSKASIKDGWGADEHGEEMGKAETHGIAEGMKAGGWEPIEEASNLRRTVSGKFGENTEEIKDVGSNWVSSLSDGIKGSWETIPTDFNNMGSEATSSFLTGFDDSSSFSLAGSNAFASLKDGLLSQSSIEMPSIGSDMVTQLVSGLGDNQGLFADASTELGTSGLTSLQNLIPDFGQTGTDDVNAIVGQFTDLTPDFANTTDLFGNAGLESLTNLIPDYEQSGTNSAMAVADAFTQQTPTVASSSENMGREAYRVVQERESDFYNSGKNFSIGLANGMSDYSAQVAQTAAQVAAAAKAAADAELGIASPSKEMMKTGKFFDQGFAEGIVDNVKVVGSASNSLANSALSAMRLAIQSINDAIDDDMDLTPVIRPVVDLSDIQSTSSMMNGMLSNAGLYSNGLGMYNPNYANQQLMGMLANGGGSTNNTTININVNGGPNANTREIADEVMDRLNMELQRRKVVWA